MLCSYEWLSGYESLIGLITVEPAAAVQGSAAYKRFLYVLVLTKCCVPYYLFSLPDHQQERRQNQTNVSRLLCLTVTILRVECVRIVLDGTLLQEFSPAFTVYFRHNSCKDSIGLSTNIYRVVVCRK